jgi:hypothetical protein
VGCSYGADGLEGGPRQIELPDAKPVPRGEGEPMTMREVLNELPEEARAHALETVDYGCRSGSCSA